MNRGKLIRYAVIVVLVLVIILTIAAFGGALIGMLRAHLVM